MTAALASCLLAAQRELGQSQWWGAEKMRRHQEALLGALLRHAKRYVPLYAERDGLRVLTRREVQTGALAASEVPPGHGAVSVAVSGGSSGVPVRVLKTELHDLMWNAVHVREEVWHRRDPSGAMLRIRRSPPGLTPEQEALVRSPSGLAWPDYGPPTNLLWPTGPVWIMDDRVDVAAQAELLHRVRPRYLFTFPSNLRLLLSHLRGTPAPGFLESVWTMSEAVDDSLRESCREVLGCRIVHNYTSAEAGYIALQCPERDHFHVQSEAVLLEVLADDDTPCLPGEVGRAVLTPLHNYAMPLIRYDIGDRVELGPPCSCGRGLPVITRVVGRAFDYVTSASGVRRPVDQGYYRISSVPSVREFQVVQRSVGLIEAMLVLSAPLAPADEARILDVLGREFGDEFQYRLTPCESIPRTAAGKLRSFVSELSA